MDNVEHAEDCMWNLKKIKKTLNWWSMMGIKECPECSAEVK